MARDHARIRLDIWADDDFRDLTAHEQWLYLHLLTSPDLSFAGIADWRPARIAAHTTDMDAQLVDDVGAGLESRHFLVIDRRSEEALIRSFVKHDGLMKSPNMAKALVKDHASIGSTVLRAVIVDQLTRLREKAPDLRWDEVAGVLGKRSMTVDEALAALSGNPSANPSVNPSAIPSGKGSATPFLPSSLPPVLPGAPTTPSRRRPSTTIPAPWAPNDKHKEQAYLKGVDVGVEATRFRNWAEAKDQRYVDWDAAFRNWIDNARTTPTKPKGGHPGDQLSW